MMAHAGLVLAINLLPIAADHGPTDITVRLDALSGGSRAAVEVIAEPAVEFSVDSKTPPQVRQPVRGTRAVLQLTPGVWIIRASAPGHWGPAATINVTNDPQAVDLRLLGAATLSGRVVVAKNVAMPATLRMELAERSAVVRRSDPLATVACPVADGSWTCTVPAGTYDIKISAAGFAGIYLWDLHVAAAKQLDVGVLALHQGASVVGRVRGVRGAPGPGCRVTLTTPDGEPLKDVDLTEARSRNAPPRTRTFSGAVNGRGFYQLLAVPPGEYIAVAEDEQRAQARLPILVMRDAETTVDPLVLEQPRTLKMSIDPPMHPSKVPWSVQILGRGPVPGGIRQEPDIVMSPSGSVQKRDLTPGAYRVTVKALGTRWLSEEVDVSESRHLQLHVPIANVRGTVRLGGEPLEALLTFGGVYGWVSVPLESDAEGRFSGALPTVPGQEWEVTIESSRPPVKRTLQRVKPVFDASEQDAEVLIDLPNNTLAGQVVDETDRPVPKAIVNCQSVGAVERLIQTSPDDQGRFQLSALPAGAVMIAADSFAGYADATTVQIADGSETHVRLRLRPKVGIRGRVVSPQGEPVAAATLAVAPQGVPLWLDSDSRTDTQGRFVVRVPQSAARVTVSVGARGFAFKTVTLPADPARIFTVRVEPFGGTLELEWPQVEGPTVDWSAPRPYLVHAGSYEPVEFLRGWAAINADEFESQPDSMSGGPVVIPRMAPGSYALCLATLPESWKLGSQVLPAGCATGYLGVGSTLRLRLAGTRKPAASE